MQTKVGSATTNYLYGLERLASVSGSTTTWYGTDALGSVRLTMSNAGVPLDTFDYDPWGVPQAAAPPTFGFTGELQDAATGLVNLRARWYQPTSGRFTSRDPFEGFNEQPYSLNPYQYAYSDPVLNTDPTGECIPRDIGGADDCYFIGWDPRKWNWADGAAYYDGPMGAIGKLAAIALFPPTAYVFGAENFTRGYVRYSKNPNPCDGLLVFVDGVLLFLPVASSLTGGGSGLAGSGAVRALTGSGLLGLRQAVQTGIGTRILGNYMRYATDPSGASGGGGGGPPKSDITSTPGGRRLTNHARESLLRHGFREPFSEVDDIIDNYSRVRTQRDGGKVYIKKASGSGQRYSIAIEGNEGIVTAMRNLGRQELENLGRRYGFDPRP